MQTKNCEKCSQNIAWVGIWVNLLLVIMKIWVGITSGSKACIADGLHSASNIITAFAIMVSQRVSKRKKSHLYPYGYGKIEFLAAGFVTLLIIVGALVLVVISIDHMVNKPSMSPHYTALLMAVISIGANEMMFRYMRCVGTQMKSQTILANAWANRADCFSSLAVVVGVVASKLGLNHLDPIAALFVVAIIIKVSAKILIDSVRALMDTSVNDQYGKDIVTLISGLKEVESIHSVRTRQMGQKIWAEIHILVNAQKSIVETQVIANTIKETLLTQIMDLERVMVNFSPLEEQ